MLHQFAKYFTLTLIRLGAPLPDLLLSRVQEFVQIKRLLETLAINCVLDVGANRGQTVQLLRGLGFQGFIFSFEPLSHNYSVLEQTCRKDPKWQGFQVALGEAPVSLPLQVNPASYEMSSLLTFQSPPPGLFEETVQVIPLDTIFDSLIQPIAEPRVFLKIDTEGYDLKVFRGASQSLPQILALQAEVFVQSIYKHAPHYLDALAEYELAGFTPVHLSPVSRSASGNLVCLNSLMKRAS